MKKEDIEKKIEKLRKELSEYNFQYYTSKKTNISDYDFDQKLKILSSLEKEHPELYDLSSPTMRIGYGKLSPSYSIILHKYKMYSLQNTYSKKELTVWKKKINKSISSSFVCELKYDGISINLIYKKGILTYALTRGNGNKGEDVTKQVKTIQSIPLRIREETFPPYIEIRGEIFIPIKNFLEINERRIKYGKKPFSNPRNTASGTLKCKDIKEVYRRSLSCIVYSAIGKNIPFNTHYQSLIDLRKWGFPVPKPETISLCKKKEDIFHFIDYWNIYKNKLTYHIDGIVVKVNEYYHQSILGYTNKYPRWAIAYKFRQEKLSETKLLHVSFHTGRTGIITPIAHVVPIWITGTIVKKITLYNNRFIKKIGIHDGDYLFLEKRGGIIPKITRVNESKRPLFRSTTPITFIKTCPSCGSPLRKNKELFYCQNVNLCPSQHIEKIRHFVSEKAMNIKGIGNKIIKKLYEKGFLYSIPDLYSLKKETLLQIDGLKEKLADSLIKNIEKSKKNPYHIVLYSIGIPHVGKVVSKELTKRFLNLDSLIEAAHYNQLKSILNIGKKITESIRTYFSIQENKNMIKKLMKHGLFIFNNLSLSRKKIYPPIEGKSFLFTGKLSTISRKKAIKMVEFLGGKVSDTINNHIHFLVVGKNPGSKLERCRIKYPIKILTENVFIDLIKKGKKSTS
ncbi:NAD-dependent DNA ligase LigA [Blattabacterium cuenoti]|uniref:NAD-dependent DNA ligase LigA n=1 Tax=Blattabacterium cuenoti TaxID=1653831 RepID=UPI00163BDE61|nr:NAD-dependent DNA ligase LigA [Blattabacterium cuenoti]